MFFRGLFHLHCSKLQDRHFLARYEKPTLFTVFLGNTRRGNWFSSSHCQIYSRIAPLTWVKLLLINLSMGGSFARKKICSGSSDNAEIRKEKAQSRKGEWIHYEMERGWLLGEMLAQLNSQGIFPGAAFHSISRFANRGLMYKKKRISVGAVLDGFSSVSVCLRLWPWHLKLFAGFTLIWQSCNSCKILNFFKLPKGKYSAIREEKNTTLGERRLGGLHDLFDTKHQRGGEMQNPQLAKITKLELKSEQAPGSLALS